MRWTCLILLAAVVALSPLALAQNPRAAGKEASQPARLYLPSQSIDFTAEPGSAPSMLGNAQVHPVELQGVGMSQVPEPTSMTVFGLLATAFLIRRRRLQLA
jgi:hypothetical protein